MLTLSYHFRTKVLALTISQHTDATWGIISVPFTNPEHEWVKMVERSFLDDKSYSEELNETFEYLIPPHTRSPTWEKCNQPSVNVQLPASHYRLYWTRRSDPNAGITVAVDFQVRYHAYCQQGNSHTSISSTTNIHNRQWGSKTCYCFSISQAGHRPSPTSPHAGKNRP